MSMKDKWKNNSVKYLASALTVSLFCVGVAAGSDNSYSRLGSKAEHDRYGELLDQGYDWEVATDQAAEEFGYDGGCKTGGIDGLYPDGSPAPDARPGTKGYEMLHGSGGSSATAEKCSHDWVVTDSVEPTCQKEGYVAYACSKCGKEKKEKAAKTEHSYKLVSETEGDCKNRAVQTFECEYCGEQMTKEGEFENHKYELTKDSTGATRTEDGTLTYVCYVCGDTCTENEPATGHTFATTKKVVQEPTCTEDGYKAYVCENCGEEKEPEVIPATGHDYDTDIIKEPTFFSNGSQFSVCTKCRDMVSEDIPRTMPEWVPPVALLSAVLAAVVIVLIVRKKKKK